MMTAQPTRVRCGNKRLHGTDVVYHESAAAVRACYAGTYGAGVLAEPSGQALQSNRTAEAFGAAPAAPAPAPAPAGRTFSSLQQAFRASMERSTPEAPAPAPEPTPAAPVEPQAPRLSKAELRARLASIPTGEKGTAYFALVRDGETKFYRVKNENGFVSLAAQGGPTLYPVDFRRALPILLEIAEDPQGAAMRYASEVGRCWKCNLPLTDEVSRARGMGPVCAGRE